MVLTAETTAFLQSQGISVPSAGLDASTTTNLKQKVTDMYNDQSAYASNLSSAALQYAMVNSRNASLTDLANKATALNTSGKSETERELNTAKRQVEINNWAYENKMDTLFFLQILFIFFCITAIILYLRHSLVLTGSVAYTLIGILFLIVLGVLLNRWIYTIRIRDNRYWNRKYLTADNALSSKLNTCT